MSCNLCGLCQFSEPSGIRGSGPRRAKIMIVNGYATDLDEDKEIATMEEEVKNQLLSLGYKLQDIYYTNAVKCRTPKGHKIKVSEIKKCSEYLKEELKKVQPEYVLLLGAQATQAAINKKLSDIQGTLYEEDGVKYFATYSPRVIYYDVTKAPLVIKDLKLFLELTKGQEIHSKVNINVKVITSLEEAKAAFKEYKKKYKTISYDIETTGLNRYEDKINLIGFGNNKVQYIVPINAKFGPLENEPEKQKKIAKYVIKQIDTFKDKIGANVKFDNLFFREHYGQSPSPTFDVVLASHLLDENTPNGLKPNAVFEFNASNWDVDINLKKGKILSEEKLKEYYNYLAYDIYYTHRLFLRFKKKLKNDKSLWLIYKHLVMPAARAYEDIEEYGVYVYPERFKELEVNLRAKLENKVKEMHDTLPEELKDLEINWNSDAQIRTLLYDKLGLPVIEKTAAGAPSTSESVLKRLSKEHPVVPLILDYRGIAIQISHFVDGWKSRMHEGRLHPSFKVHGTVTGRTSCNNPNLQQVPRDKDIRSLIGAPPGWTMVESDYSQLELRVAALVSQDSTMRRLFQMGEDIHTVTGKAVSGKEELSYEERKRAKAVNFGFVYGMGWRKFKDYARDSYDVHLTDKEAEEYRKRFFDTYHELPQWHMKQRKIVKYAGQVRNPIGRIRRLPDIFSKDKSKVAEAERQSINSPVQGFGSDLCLLSMVEAHHHFPRDKARCIGTVHDAILWEVRDDFVEEFCIKLKQIMESPTKLKEVFKFESNVPIITDVEIGNWGRGKELEEWLKEYNQK